jgi:hypothetical protein
MAEMASSLNLVLTALSEDDYDAAARHLREAPNAEVLLAQVATSTDPGPRGYIAGLAAELLPSELAIPLVRKMLDDVDASTRIDALPVYIALDPGGMPPLLAKIRRRLLSINDSEVLSTAWALASLGDADSAALIAEVRDSKPPDAALHKSLDVVWTYLTGPERVVTRIQEHDHESMMWLAYAATLMGTDDAKRALRHCSERAPDDLCRGFCQRELSEDGAGSSGDIPAR